MNPTGSILVLSLIAAMASTSLPSMAATGWDEQDALSVFLAQSPQVSAIRQSVGVARAERVAAGVWANPALDASREQIFSNGGPTEQHRVGLAVPVMLPGKRDLRLAIADAGVEASEAQVQRRVADLVAQFRRTFESAYFSEQRARALEEGLAAYTRLEGVVRARQRTGETAGYDAMRLRLQKAAIEARRSTQQVEAQQARKRLATLLGRPVEAPLKLATLDAVPEEGWLIQEALSRRAELVALQAERRHAQRAIELADRMRWPDPTISMGLRQTNEPTVQGLGYAAGVSWPLPFFDQGQGARARAQAEVKRLEAEEEALTSRLRGEVATARQALIAQRTIHDRYRAQVLTEAPRVVTVAEVAYREGEQGIVPLLDAHEAATEARLQNLELAEAAHVALLDLEVLIGRPLPDTMGDLK